MERFNKCLLYIALLNIYINYSDCGCKENHEEAVDTYNECMQNSDLEYLLQLKVESLGRKELCRLFGLSLRCTTAGNLKMKNCSEWQDNQMTNHLMGLRAYQTVECGAEEAKPVDEAEIVICEKFTEKGRRACDARYSYDYAKFLPLPVVEMELDEKLWTHKDCQVKFQWADCQIREYAKCKVKTARNYYENLFTSVLRAYPNCIKALGADLEYYTPGPFNSCSSTSSSLALLLLAIISLTF